MSKVIAMRQESESVFEIGAGLPCDLSTLIDTRLLVQANSGGGKSWALRRILEQTHGRVQHLVIDPEGEFASLRERFDYVLAARNGGDTIADPRSAKLLAERLLELGVSAVLDIYELKAHERIRFVRFFLEALVDAPKALWHPAIVVVDEAHVFCPQQGEAESAGPVIDLATRGRKRGFCAVLATQRLSKLHKDAAAECNNKMIGRTGLDVDVKRAADELGFGKERWRELRELEAGAFFAFGPAMSRAVVAARVGAVVTSHPKAGSRIAFAAPPPTAKVRALLPKLADLPAEAEARERTVADLQKEVAGLKRELAAAQKAAPAPVAERVEVPVLTPAQEAQLQRLVDWAASVDAAIARTCEELSRDGQNAGMLLGAVKELQSSIKIAVAPPPHRHTPAGARTALNGGDHGPRPSMRVSRPASSGNAAASLPKGENATLTVAAQYPDGATREQVSILTGYKRSSRDTYIQRLREQGFVDIRQGFIVATDAGIAALGPNFEPLPTGAELRRHWLERLPEGERRVLEVVIKAHPRAVARDDIDSATGYKRSSRDTYLQRLGMRQLVESVGRGEVKASETLFG